MGARNPSLSEVLAQDNSLARGPRSPGAKPGFFGGPGGAGVLGKNRSGVRVRRMAGDARLPRIPACAADLKIRRGGTVMHLKPLNQQVVVVVGASSGIGRATALCLAAEGASVLVVARSRTGLDSLVDEIRVNGGVALPVVADVSDADQMRHVADLAIAELGRIDTWAHVA